jgi:hypothetical protein
MKCNKMDNKRKVMDDFPERLMGAFQNSEEMDIASHYLLLKSIGLKQLNRVKGALNKGLQLFLKTIIPDEENCINAIQKNRPFQN